MAHKNPIERKEYHKNYHKKNYSPTSESLSKQAAAARINREKDPLRYRVHVHQFGVRKRAPDTWKESSITNEVLYNWLKSNHGLPCPYCGEASTHIDHKQPLAKGGAHDLDNLQTICAACNYAKRDMTEKEFLSYINRLCRKWISSSCWRGESAGSRDLPDTG